MRITHLLKIIEYGYVLIVTLYVLLEFVFKIRDYRYVLFTREGKFSKALMIRLRRITREGKFSKALMITSLLSLPYENSKLYISNFSQ